MLEIGNDALTFSFPEVHNAAQLRVFFRAASAPEEPVAINPRPVNGGLELATPGNFVLHLRPKIVGADRCYPFAVILSVGGRNAVTGELVNAELRRTPQNYLATPPQGGIDGYFHGGQVHPFRAAGPSSPNKVRLAIKVFPMKGEVCERMINRLFLIGRPPDSRTRFDLEHGGERNCEPLYEDNCSLGDWDQSREESATIWLSGQ